MVSSHKYLYACPCYSELIVLLMTHCRLLYLNLRPPQLFFVSHRLKKIDINGRGYFSLQLRIEALSSIICSKVALCMG